MVELCTWRFRTSFLAISRQPAQPEVDLVRAAVHAREREARVGERILLAAEQDRTDAGRGVDREQLVARVADADRTLTVQQLALDLIRGLHTLSRARRARTGDRRVLYVLRKTKCRQMLERRARGRAEFAQ